MGDVDVLLLPVGGYFTIDPKEASSVMGEVKPAITIPMHFKTAKCDFPIAPVEEFTKGKERVRNTCSPEIESRRGRCRRNRRSCPSHMPSRRERCSRNCIQKKKSKKR